MVTAKNFAYLKCEVDIGKVVEHEIFFYHIYSRESRSCVFVETCFWVHKRGIMHIQV